MTKLIDVSQWNGGINWQAVKDAGWHAIIRVGYGSDYYDQDDWTANQNMDECERLGIPYGVYLYSYATNDDMARSEAQHILRMIQGRNLSYPVYLDVEEPGTEWYARRACEVVGPIIEAAGYWFGIYSATSWWNAYLGGLENQYTRWLANWGVPAPPLSCDIWQYTSDEVGPGCSGRTDCNIVYRDFPAEIRGGAPAPVRPEPAPAPDGTIEDLAQRVIAGEFGNGADREAALGARYWEVQNRVNEILSSGCEHYVPTDDELADAVLRGEYGNGEDRKRALGDRYWAVQDIVNARLGASAPAVDIDALAWACIRGDYGNGQARRDALGDLYDQVQARVNELL